MISARRDVGDDPGVLSRSWSGVSAFKQNRALMVYGLTLLDCNHDHYVIESNIQAVFAPLVDLQRLLP